MNLIREDKVISGTHSLRLGRVSLSSQIYHVTSVTKHRTPHFVSFSLCRFLVKALNGCPHTHTLAYVVMPDHIHWLLQLQGAEASLSKSVAHIKNVSAGFAYTQCGIKGLWQKGFYDHAVRRDEDLIQIARYIVANPIRAGLVRSVRDYSHWDAMWL